MSKGRNTTPVTVRVPDDFLEKFKTEAARRGKPYTSLIRELMYKGIGVSLPVVKVPVAPENILPSPINRGSNTLKLKRKNKRR
ncbi:hypothetical protein Dform_00514 [Dehalogenimonas formicexedens]|uniref:Uncharacterized protein n=1 Tax=Dehalogenimonas formicexedens TaxID=1839801 RepID=A0A1P8F5V9_9CHLR|nr:hypothetical protein Dform_00514 [Dehalogenimonas formicexedens]